MKFKKVSKSGKITVIWMSAVIVITCLNVTGIFCLATTLSEIIFIKKIQKEDKENIQK